MDTATTTRPLALRLRLDRGRIAGASIRLSLLLVAFALGGSLYEHLVVDTVWPEHPQVIQPDRGGIDRKLFWIPIHAALTLSLLSALWSAWVWPRARRLLWVAIALYAAMRIWSALYFIPLALRFEALTELPPDLHGQATTWVLLSLLRAPMLVGSLVALAKANQALGLPRR